MAAIRKCGISSSPTRNPLLQHHGRRRMTLGMLLLSATDGEWKAHPQQSMLRRGTTNNEAVICRKTLKDLMSSSKNLFDNTMVDAHQVFVFQEQRSTGAEIMPPLIGGGGRGGRRVKRGINRPATASAGLRIRFFKPAWRPVLGAIPEGNLFDAPLHCLSSESLSYRNC